MTIKLEKLVLRGPEAVYENPLPRFRDAEHDRVIMNNGSLKPDEAGETLGKNTGTRVLPYRMQDEYTRSREPVERDVIVMENDKLKAVFLPWHGGKLYSLTEKATGRPILFTNSVFQPANLAIRDAWTSGGIEWNIGQLGHTFSTCSNVFFAKITPDNAEPFLRMYDYERQKGIFWSIDFHLPDGTDALCAHVRIVNDEPFEKPMYWWTNTACIETDNCRVFSESADVIYQDWVKYTDESGKTKYRANGFGHAKMPFYTDETGFNHIEYDASYPKRCPRSCEYFFQNDADLTVPWEAVGYEDGFMFFEKSTQPLRFRKMFCWGNGRGGRFWCDFLSEPGKGDYVELQAGIAPTQVHGASIAASSEIRFTQAFSCARVDEASMLYGDWDESKKTVHETVSGVLSDAELLSLDKRASELSKADAGFEILFDGTGWGALERIRRNMQGADIPSGFCFPNSTMTSEQSQWLSLLKTGKLENANAESFMVNDDWRSALENDSSDAAKLLLGILHMENGRTEEAEKAWHAVSDKRFMPMALRNLSQAALGRGDENGAIELMKRAIVEGGDELHCAYMREYMQLLMNAKRYQEAWDAFANAPERIRKDDRASLLAGTAAIETGEYAYLDELFKTEHATIREGETSLTELWFRREAAREAEKRGVSVSEALIKEITETLLPPREIDFRMN